MFVNVQTRHELIEIDPVTDRVVGRTALPGANGNHGLLIEPRQRRAFIACEGNDTLLVLDLESKKVLSSFAVGGDPDVLAYDDALQTLYVAGEAGVVSIFKITSGEATKIAEGFVGPDAHVVAVDPVSHKSYFPLKNLAEKTVLRIMAPIAVSGAK